MKIEVKQIQEVPYFVVPDGTIVAIQDVAVTLGPDGIPSVTAMTPFGATQFIAESSFDELCAHARSKAN